MEEHNEVVPQDTGQDLREKPGVVVERLEFQPPTIPSEGMFQLDAVEAEIKRLDSLKRSLRKFLSKMIDVEDVDETHREGVADGVRRACHMRFNVKYKDAMEQIVNNLVPKSKHGAAQEIIDSCKTSQWIDKFSVVEEDEGDEDF